MADAMVPYGPLLQARSEATLYHDGLGRKTTSLSADVQTTGMAGAGYDALVMLRADLAGGGSPFTHNKPTAGLMAARLAGASSSSGGWTQA